MLLLTVSRKRWSVTGAAKAEEEEAADEDDEGE